MWTVICNIYDIHVLYMYICVNYYQILMNKSYFPSQIQIYILD